MMQDLRDKIQELDRLKEAYELANLRIKKFEVDDESGELERLRQELIIRNSEIDNKNRKIEELSRDLQVKTQNLQKLVNTELWSKNKEIAKLHNQTMSANQAHETSRGNRLENVQEERAVYQLGALLRGLNDIGIRVGFARDAVQLSRVDNDEPIDIKTMTEYVKKLVSQKVELEREVDYLRWLKLVAQPDVSSNQELDSCPHSDNDRARRYCEMLRTHVKDLFKFMKEMLKTTHYPESIVSDHRNIVLDVLVSSKTLYDDFVRAQEERVPWEDIGNDYDDLVRRSQSTELAPLDVAVKLEPSEALSDSEAFSEPDRKVSLARIGLRETHKAHKSSNRPRVSKYTKSLSDSEDSIDCVPHQKGAYGTDLGSETDAAQQIHQLMETNRLLSTELRALREEILSKVSLDNVCIPSPFRPRHTVRVW